MIDESYLKGMFMLTISPIRNNNFVLNIQDKKILETPSTESSNNEVLQKAPISAVLSNRNINFKARIVKDIEHNEYINMSEEEREVCRKKYNDFFKLINIDDLYMPKGRSIHSKLPLYYKADMDDFLDVASEYNKYKDNKIICVGRSPKWFLNASIWMKDGIEDYDFIAFSSNWYSRNQDGMGRIQTIKEDKVPNEKERKAYKDYLKRKNCYPTDIIQAAKETGKPVIVTDYIHSGCGLASFLDLLAGYAKEEGVLEDFASSIKLVTLSSMDYFEELGRTNSYAYPTVIMPDILKPFNIPQEYHDMSADVMRQVLINKNTNECRSTYYPPDAWLAYNPDKFRTGLIPDEELKKMAKRFRQRTGNEFTDGMKDFRNLMNFRILEARDIIKCK